MTKPAATLEDIKNAGCEVEAGQFWQEHVGQHILTEQVDPAIFAQCEMVTATCKTCGVTKTLIQPATANSVPVCNAAFSLSRSFEMREQDRNSNRKKLSRMAEGHNALVTATGTTLKAPRHDFKGGNIAIQTEGSSRDFRRWFKKNIPDEPYLYAEFAKKPLTPGDLKVNQSKRFVMVSTTGGNQAVDLERIKEMRSAAGDLPSKTVSRFIYDVWRERAGDTRAKDRNDKIREKHPEMAALSDPRLCPVPQDAEHLWLIDEIRTEEEAAK